MIFFEHFHIGYVTRVNVFSTTTLDIPFHGAIDRGNDILRTSTLRT